MRSLIITIDLEALRFNLSQVRKITPQSRIFAVLKADAYGHGAVECAKALDDANGFAVVSPLEAVTLREAGILKPLLVIQGAMSAELALEAAVKDIQLAVHSDYQLDLLDKIHIYPDHPLKVWIKLDTGMGRLGFREQRLDGVVAQLESMSGVIIQGCLSHFSCADEPDNPYTGEQIRRFKNAVKGYAFDTSLANSAGVIAWPESRTGWVRPGIMLYGADPFWPNESVSLKPVMTVRAPLIVVRKMNIGDTIGYANTYRCSREMRIGLVGAGYGDGYPRHVQKGACVLIDGIRCEILGRVSMDSLAVDLSALDDPRPGDAATLWGEGLPVEEVAAFAGTISYELLCQIRGQRHYPDSR